MNIKVTFENYDKWVSKTITKTTPLALKGLTHALTLIKGRAQYAYLTGPAPEHLRVGKSGTGGALRQNLMFIINSLGDTAEATLVAPSIAWYGAVWEAVGRYKHRKGKLFKNATPMARPFARPAWEDEKERAKTALLKELVMGLR